MANFVLISSVINNKYNIRNWPTMKLKAWSTLFTRLTNLTLNLSKLTIWWKSFAGASRETEKRPKNIQKVTEVNLLKNQVLFGKSHSGWNYVWTLETTYEAIKKSDDEFLICKKTEIQLFYIIYWHAYFRLMFTM